jgi:hypothetical protein
MINMMMPTMLQNFPFQMKKLFYTNIQSQSLIKELLK